MRTVAAVGDLTDRAVAAVAGVPGAARRLPGLVRRAWSAPRYRWTGVGAGLAMLLLYLVAIGDLAFSRGGPAGPAVRIAADWAGNLTGTRAPWLFESVAAVRPAPWLTVFVSPGNLVLGGVLATLLALNVTVTAYQVFTARECRRTAFGRLFAALPAFGAGIACCAPALLLAFGTGFAAALLPVFLPLRSWLFPVSVLLLAGMLLRTVRRSPPDAVIADGGAAVGVPNRTGS